MRIIKTIGLIGGMSWESTAVYYTQLNRMTREHLGGLHSAPLLLFSFDFAEIERLQSDGGWEAATQRMIDAARRLEQAGAHCLLICTNTMHLMADQIQQAIDIPLLHIADATAAAVNRSQASAPLLLATRYTMEADFYRARLADHGVTALLPGAADRSIVHDIIYDELCQGIIRAESKQAYLQVIGKAINQGADSVILGCTEVGLLLSENDLAVPVFDTTALHAEAAINFALG